MAHPGGWPRAYHEDREKRPTGPGVTGKEETGMKTMNGRRNHALYGVWIVQR